MRQIIILLGLIMLTGYAPTPTDIILTKKSAETVVTNFMATMGAHLTLDDYDMYKKSTRLEKYILPADLEKYKTQNESVLVNTYQSGDFKITKTELPFVTAKVKLQKIKGQPKPQWTIKLTFKLTVYQGQVYIVPSSMENNFINAWWTVEEI